MNVTPHQNQLIQRFWKVGYFNAEDLRLIYSSELSRIECLGHLESLGIIKMKEGTNKFLINREKYLELQE